MIKFTISGFTYPQLGKRCNYITSRIKIFLTLFVILFISSFQLFAQVAPVNPPIGGFHIDGGLRANTPTLGVGDWVVGTPAVTGAGATGGSVFTDAGATQPGLNAKLISPRDPYNSSSDIIFTQGSKFDYNPNNWAWTTGAPPNKDDINNAMYLVTKGTNGNDWLIMGGDRLSTNGTSYLDFELFQNTVTRTGNGTSGAFTSSGTQGGRTVNDLVISMEYSNGGSKPIVSIYQWRLVSSNTYDYVLIPSSTAIPTEPGKTIGDYAFAETNRTGTENVPFSAFGSTTYQQFAFVEAAVNMTKIISALGDPCLGLSVKTIFIKSKASNSLNAALKDVVEPIQVSINFGSATIAYGGPYCPTGTASVTQTGVTGGTYSYAAKSPTPSTNTLSLNTTTGEINLAASMPGTYTVTYTYTTNGCTKTAKADVTINANPAAPTLGGADPTCSDNTGSITLTATTGSTYSFDAGAYLAYPTGGWTGLAAGSMHTVSEKNSAGCTSLNASRTIGNVVSTPAAPTLGGADPTCSDNTGSITLTATTGSTYSFDAGAYLAYPTGGWTGLAAGSMHTVSEKNSAGCTSPNASRTIGNALSTPAAPTLGGADPSCSDNIGSITLTATTGSTYSFDAGAYLAYPTGGWTGLAAGSTHTVSEKNSAGCISPNASRTIAAQPLTPPRPAVTITEPTLCGTSTATITITCPLTYTANGTTITYEYKNGNGPWQQSPVFSGLTAGSGFSITVRNATTLCESAATDCNNYSGYTCTQPTSATQARAVTVMPAIQPETKVTAYPNPFNDKVKFSFKPALSGMGSLDLYNIMGQKVKTVFQGHVEAGQVQNVEYAVPNAQRSNLIYIFRVGNQRSTGKLINLKR
ncbi:hypothetical protein [Segetibacter koreensis]|uniref:hypothetical protein n=1 Tax=Segetibacter koreensis TaxID=398037 RepID=UPI00052462F0|nr:hypothetical protein [Segetibacter koreensis]